MKNAIDGTNDFITEEDEPILEHITDVVIEDGIDTFKLHFHFSPNDFFRLVPKLPIRNSCSELFVSTSAGARENPPQRSLSGMVMGVSAFQTVSHPRMIGSRQSDQNGNLLT